MQYTNIPSTHWNHKNILLISWDYPFKLNTTISGYQAGCRLHSQQFWRPRHSTGQVDRHVGSSIKDQSFSSFSLVHPFASIGKMALYDLIYIVW
jgi:hypothetical protein